MNAIEKLTTEGIGFELRYIKNSEYDVFSGGCEKEREKSVPIRFIEPNGKPWAELKYLKRGKPHVNKGKWRLKFTTGDSSTSRWDKKSSFLGNTIEEVCEKAYNYYIDHIKPVRNRYKSLLKKQSKYTKENPAIIQL